MDKRVQGDTRPGEGGLKSPVSPKALYLRCQCIVIWSLAGQKNVREALFLPHDDVTEPTVAFILADAVPEPLVKDIVLLCLQLPLHGAVQVQASIGQSRTFQNQKSYMRNWSALYHHTNQLEKAQISSGKGQGAQGIKEFRTYMTHLAGLFTQKAPKNWRPKKSTIPGINQQIQQGCKIQD